MRVLFLESARPGFVGCDLQIARTAAEAIALLGEKQFDLASLDHDLGGTQMAESDEQSGHHVAEAIASLPVGARPAVIVHSFNPVGAEKMMQTLVAGGVLCARAAYGSNAYWKTVVSVSV